MAPQAQLEIIRPDGEIEFYDLDPRKGVTNIGRHPDNDIVIASPGVALFHAVLDHRQTPFQVMLLSDEAEMRAAGQRLAPNVPAAVGNWDSLEVDGTTLVVLIGASAPALQEPAPVPARTTGVPVPDTVPRAEATAMVPVPSAPPGAFSPVDLADQTDDIILVEVTNTEWAVNVEETAVCQVTIINGGSLVAMFEVAVLGIDPDWVVISPPHVNLNEGARGTVHIAVTAPRLPASEAKTYPLVIEVTSYNYPGHVSRTSGRLTIQPYYEFSVGEVSPKQQTIHWSRRAGRVTIPLNNKGNNQTLFRLEGEDVERLCLFEFQVPGEEVALVRQAEVGVPPGQAHTIPVLITPPRRLVGLRRRSYSYTITTSMAAGDQIPRSVMGEVKSAPLIGPWMILLAALCLAVLLGFLFRPDAEPLLAADITHIEEPGGKVTLSYDASRFSPASILTRLNALFLKLTLEQRPEDGEWQPLRSPSEFDGPVDSLVDAPRVNTQYQLRARTWVSDLIPAFEGLSPVVQVLVRPVEPKITFRADRNPILAGQTVTLIWEVLYAESLVLEHDGIQETLQGDQLQRGQYSAALEKETTFTLIASNTSWDKEVRASQQIKVLYPTPVVIQFDVAPSTITLGESVELQWEVTGAEGVTIDPLGGFSIKGSSSDQPTELRRYKLVAFKNVADGSRVESVPLEKVVYVNTPVPPTPTPAAPEIQLFEATPKQVVQGDHKIVRLSWSVTGQTTNIEITAPDVKLGGLNAQGSIEVTVDETTLFILTAYNGDLSRSKPVEVTAVEPTPTLTPTPTPTATPPPTPTPTPFPPPIIKSFEAEGTGVRPGSWSQGENGPMWVYPVEAGTEFNLTWEVVNADLVMLVDPPGPRGLTDSLGPLVLVDNKTYQLTAFNNQELNKVNAFVRMEVFLPPPPPPPYNLQGEVSASPSGVTLTWSYRPSADTPILGFRVYRANVSPQTEFQRVGPELLPPDPPYAFLDELPPAEVCGKAYYVVAVYQDIIADEERETDASATSWYTLPCSP